MIRKWLKVLSGNYEVSVEELHYIFVSDEALLQMNNEYLGHNTYTDIITFNNSESGDIAGDIFISADRVTENAKTYKTTAEKEWVRVMAHGLLHLIGFNDKKPKEKSAMRDAEESAIRLYLSIKKEIKKP